MSALTAGKTRLDVYLVEEGSAENRSRAQALIMAGKVLVNGARAKKAGQPVGPEDLVAVVDINGWASRGALKLLHAFEAFPQLEAAVLGADCLDIGASTGGFTDVMLRRGARSVVALDVGYGQLHERLRQDERVTVLDRTNIRAIEPGALPTTPTFATCDASFISVTLFMPVVFRELADGGSYVILVKPQFEVGRDNVGKGGVVRDDGLRADALARVVQAATDVGFDVVGSDDSPVHGPSGNREILLVLQKPLSSPA